MGNDRRLRVRFRLTPSEREKEKGYGQHPENIKKNKFFHLVSSFKFKYKPSSEGFQDIDEEQMDLFTEVDGQI